MKLLITNFEDELRELAETATEIKVLIAFLTEEGLRWLPEEKMPASDFIVGVDLGITSPDALRTLQSGEAGVRVFQEPGRLFHPKAIYLKTHEAEHLIVGSNNLTASGISSNHELATKSERNADSEEAFVDFLAHFDSLKSHQGCFIPVDAFFDSYRPTQIQNQLAGQLATPTFDPEAAQPSPSFTIDPSSTSSLGAFLQELAKKFLQLDRRQGQKIRNHPLKVANDEEFRPFFKQIVAEASQGRLEGRSNLNIYGKWYRIPNISAFHPELETYEKTDSTGRLGLQVHFTGNDQQYESVFFSIVLMYNVPRSNREGTMPEAVARRHGRVLGHLRGFSQNAQVDSPGFLHWSYDKDHFLWSKPLLTYAYEIDSLPPDEKLISDLATLASALNGAMLIG